MDSSSHLDILEGNARGCGRTSKATVAKKSFLKIVSTQERSMPQDRTYRRDAGFCGIAELLVFQHHGGGKELLWRKALPLARAR
jgi:hypothetical protein